MADDPVSFAKAIEMAMAENSGELEEEGCDDAFLHSWNIRVSAAIERIDEMLGVKTGCLRQ